MVEELRRLSSRESSLCLRARALNTSFRLLSPFFNELVDAMEDTDAERPGRGANAGLDFNAGVLASAFSIGALDAAGEGTVLAAGAAGGQGGFLDN